MGGGGGREGKKQWRRKITGFFAALPCRDCQRTPHHLARHGARGVACVALACRKGVVRDEGGGGREQRGGARTTRHLTRGVRPSAWEGRDFETTWRGDRVTIFFAAQVCRGGGGGCGEGGVAAWGGWLWCVKGKGVGGWASRSCGTRNKVMEGGGWCVGGGRKRGGGVRFC